MAIITGVKFRTPSKVYYFDPGPFNPRYNDHVIVETARGVEYGTVVLPVRDVPEEEIQRPLKEVLRMATEEDIAHEKENREKEESAYKVCQAKIREHGLEMKLVSAEYTFDNSKLLFYFTADGRIDFRELVKDLASIFRTRIELRQIGVRDETRIIGGIGICGRPLCCHTYLHEFVPVSIKMAKEQNLSLNPTKISGSCGRLMCCLKNEQETYEFLNRSLPKKGDEATTPDGLVGEVQSVNILRQLVRVVVTVDNDEKEMREYPVSEITFVPRKGRKRGNEEPKENFIAEEVFEDAETLEEECELLEEMEELEEEPRKKERRKRRKKNDRKEAPKDGAASSGEDSFEGRPEKAARAEGAEKPFDMDQEEGQDGEAVKEHKRRRRHKRHQAPKDGSAEGAENGTSASGPAEQAGGNRAGGDGAVKDGSDTPEGTARKRRRRHKKRPANGGNTGGDGGNTEDGR